jgi:hypothetical protein
MELAGTEADRLALRDLCDLLAAAGHDETAALLVSRTPASTDRLH